MSSIYSVSSAGSGTTAKARTAAVEQRIYQLSVHSDSTETISTTPLPPLKYIPKVPRLRILLAPYMSPYEVPMNSVRTWDALHRTIRNLFGDTVFTDSPPRITNKKGLTITPSEWESLLTPNLTIIVDTCAVLPEHSINNFSNTDKKPIDSSNPTSKYNYTPMRRRKKSAGRDELKRPNMNVTAFLLADRDSHDSSILDSPISPFGFNRGSSAVLPVLRSRPMEPWEGWTSDSDAASGIVPAPLEPSRVRLKKSMEAMAGAGEGAKKSNELKRSTSVSMFSGIKRGDAKSGSQRSATQPKKKSSFASLRGKRSLEHFHRKQSGEVEREKMGELESPVKIAAGESLKEKPYTEAVEQKAKAGMNPIMSRPRPSLDQTLRPKPSFDQKARTHEGHTTPAAMQKPERITIYDSKADHEPSTRKYEAPPVYEIPKIYEKSKPDTTKSAPQFDEKRPFIPEPPAPDSAPQRKKSTKAKQPPKKKSAWSKVINAILFTFAGRPRNSMITPELSKPTQHDKHLQAIIFDPSRQVPPNPLGHLPPQPKPTVIRPAVIKNPRPLTIDIDVPTPQASSPELPDSHPRRIPSKPHQDLAKGQQSKPTTVRSQSSSTRNVDIAISKQKPHPPLPLYATSPPKPQTSTATAAGGFKFPARQDSLPFPSLQKSHPVSSLPHSSIHDNSSNSGNGLTSMFRNNSFTRHKKRSSDSSISSINSISPPIPKRGPELDLGFNAQFRIPLMDKERIQELVQAESFLDGSTLNSGRSRSGTSASETPTAVESLSERSNSQQSKLRAHEVLHTHVQTQQAGYKLTAFPPPMQRYEVKNMVPMPNQGVWQPPPLVIPARKKVQDTPPSPTSIYSTNTCGESFVLGRGRRVY